MSTYRVPPTFYDDHVDRDLPAGTVIRRNKKFVYVDLTADELADLRSDAAYYADALDNGEFTDDDWLRSVARSAQSTVAALDKQATG
jgi:hypothetical protein